MPEKASPDVFNGPSWSELRQAKHSTALWVEIHRVSDGQKVLVTITELGNFRSGAELWFRCRTQKRVAYEASGRCRHTPEDGPTTFKLTQT